MVLPLFALSASNGLIRGSCTRSVVMHANKEEAVAKLAELIDEMRHRYTLGYRPSAAQPDGKFCRTAVELTAHFYAAHSGLTPKMLAIHAKTGYYR